MKKLVLAGSLAGVALLARKCAATCSRIDFGKMVERMPENAPPRWMFRTISEIRDNTERILERLEAQPAPRARAAKAGPGPQAGEKG